MGKTIFKAGSDENPIFTVTINSIFHNHSSSDLEEYLARYFSHHGGMQWSVKKE